MTRVPPTTSLSMGNPEDDSDGPELCGADLSSGGTCERLVAECPYHGDA
jgi:hypothetical protein